jgi:hypothetical protein
MIAIPLPDPPPQATIATIDWTSFYRQPLNIYLDNNRTSRYHRLNGRTAATADRPSTLRASYHQSHPPRWLRR